MKKIGNLVSMEQIETSGLGNIHRGFKVENEKRERVLFYEIPYSLKIPEDFPQHIAVMDIIFKQQEKDFTLVAHSYISGFPLLTIIKKCEKEAFPLPLDHSLLIIERVSSAFSDFKLGFPHPLFIWLTFDGEIKCSPVPIPKIIQKVKNEDVLPYFSPQILQGEDWGRTEQVYSLGALFFELLTGKKLPLAKNEDEIIQAVVKTPLLSEGNIPKDLQVILLKAFSFKASERFQHIRDLREELGKLIYSGAYTPTTFNLAFFMHSLFREEIEKEEKKLKEEDSIDLTEILKPPKVEAPPPVAEIKKEIPKEEKKKSPLIFIGVSALAILLIVASIFLFKGQKPAPPPVQVQTKEDEELKKKLEEYEKKLKEVELERQRQKEELERLQKEAQKNPEAKKELEKKLEEQKKTEEKLKEIEQKKKEMEAVPQQKKEEIPPEKPPAPPKKEEPAPPVKEEKPEPVQKEEIKATEEPKVETPPKEEPPKLGVKEGDLLDINEVDTAPVPLSEINANFPPMARLQKITKAKVRLKILVNHKGEPEEIVVVSVSPPSNVGFDKEAVNAIKKVKFQPATKGGVKVKCWYWYTITFGK